MSNESLMLGSGNWAAKTNNLLGYVVGDISAQFTPREFTFSRGSTATFTNPAGVIQSSASGIARVQNNALLLEPQRTNSIRNSTMQGAVAGSPGTLPTNWTQSTGGLTRSIVSVGTENGLLYIDYRLQGTATGSNARLILESNSQIAAVNGQTWSHSFYVKLIQGSLNLYNSYQRYWDSSGGYVADSSVFNFTPSSNLTRFNYERTISSATTAFVQPFFEFGLTVGQTYDFTIRIAAPQLEVGAYPTTYIPTTNAAATRLVDTFSISNVFTNGWISSLGGTWYVELRNNVAYTRDTSGDVLGIGDSSFLSTTSLVIRNGGGVARLGIVKRISGTLTTLFTTTTDTVKIAIKWNGSTADIFQNGVKVVSATAFTTTNMEFFRGLGQQVPNFIQAMALYPTPLSDAQCQALTT